MTGGVTSERYRDPVGQRDAKTARRERGPV
jgi:hypothetical protein